MRVVNQSSHPLTPTSTSRPKFIHFPVVVSAGRATATRAVLLVAPHRAATAAAIVHAHESFASALFDRQLDHGRRDATTAKWDERGE